MVHFSKFAAFHSDGIRFRYHSRFQEQTGLYGPLEVSRKFAPYVGVVWSRKFGETADYARADFGRIEDTHLVADVRLWF